MNLALLLSPIGDVAQSKHATFAIWKKVNHSLCGSNQSSNWRSEVPKELKIGFNGCGMACYSAVQQDIGIVYRKEKFDLFLGGKTVGRNAHAAQPVAEGIDLRSLLDISWRIVERYRQEGHPNERFHKFFKSVSKKLKAIRFQEVLALSSKMPLCGD